jgi:P-type Cu2+ transporter
MKQCKLCQRPIDGSFDDEVFCCPGCRAVDQILATLDLSDEERSMRLQQLLDVIFSEDTPTETKLPSTDTRQEHLLISGMVCPACSWLIHHCLEKQTGVTNAVVNFVSETATVHFDPMQIGLEDISAAINTLGYRIRAEGEQGSDFDYYGFGMGWFFALNVMMTSFVVYSAETRKIPVLMEWACLILMVVFTGLTGMFGARLTIRKGIMQIKARDFRMDSLILISTVTAFAYSAYSTVTGDFKHVYFDVVCLLFMLVETGNLITTSFYNKLRRRVFEITNHLPKKVRLTECAGEFDTYRATEDLQANESFLVKQGEVMPTDGLLLEAAEFDFSLINGESKGVELQTGQFVGAGAKLQSESARLVVPQSGPSSLIKNMVDGTIAAFSANRETPSTGDAISQWFVPAIFAIAIIGGGVQALRLDLAEGLLCFMRVLIVSCPCAFGIAEPLVLTLAVDRIKALGIQIFNGNALRHRPTTIVFDKTGTLTTAAMTIGRIYWCVDESQRDLDILASLESGIEHPIAKALATLGSGISLIKRNIGPGWIRADFQGKHYTAGKLDTFPGLTLPDAMQNETGSIVAFGDDRGCRMIVSLNDTLRAETPALIDRLKETGITLEICSGDRRSPVECIANELGITYQSEMSPTDKQTHIQALQEAGQCVMMVGDGINDAQSLAAADFGLAVFSGQFPAQMSADAVFLTHSLAPLPGLLGHMQQIHKKIIWNYTWAFAYNGIGVTLALIGLLTPTFCAIGMVFSSFVIIYNSTRSKRV